MKTIPNRRQSQGGDGDGRNSASRLLSCPRVPSAPGSGGVVGVVTGTTTPYKFHWRPSMTAVSEIVASVRNQMGGVVVFVWADCSRRRRPELPGGDAAVGPRQLPRSERRAYERADALLILGFGGEKHPQRDGFANWEARDVVWREWARR
jgi:hypothetical protein